METKAESVPPADPYYKGHVKSCILYRKKMILGGRSEWCQGLKSKVSVKYVIKPITYLLNVFNNIQGGIKYQFEI